VTLFGLDLNHPHTVVWGIIIVLDRDEPSPHCRVWDFLSFWIVTLFRLALNNPHTAVCGIQKAQSRRVVERDLNNPHTAVCGIQKAQSRRVVERI